MIVSSLRSFTDSVIYSDLHQISERSLGLNVADPLRPMLCMYANTCTFYQYTLFKKILFHLFIKPVKLINCLRPNKHGI